MPIEHWTLDELRTLAYQLGRAAEDADTTPELAALLVQAEEALYDAANMLSND